MIVRCGSCRIELEVAGPGEFMCPACGTRNVVRGGAAAPDLGLPDLGLASRQTAPASEGPPPGVRWMTCTSCSYRFACGEVDEVECPTCGTKMTVPRESASAADA